MKFWTHLLDTSDFPARWHCGNWTAGHGWLHIGSDIGVWSAYFAIPCILLAFSMRRKDIPFRGVFWLFGAFILFCGLTHLMEALIFWWPAYRLAGVIKFITAVVSWTTVFVLIRVMPTAMAMRSPEELEQEVASRIKTEQTLVRSNVELEKRVQERTLELKAANEKLAAERGWLNITLASIGDGVITTDTDGRVTTLNRMAESLTGWLQADAIGESIETIFHIVNTQTREPAENPSLAALKQGVIVGLSSGTLLIAKDGTERYIDDGAAPLKNEQHATVGSVLVFRDITEQYESDRERRELAARLSTLVQNAPIGIALYDENYRFIDLNERAASMDGMPRDQHLGRSVAELLPSIGPTVESHLRLAHDSGKPVTDVEMTGETPAIPGVKRHWIASHYPIYDDRQTLLGIGAVTLEITDRKRSEEALRYQYELTRAITDNATTAIFVVDAQGRCTFMNPAAEELTGYTFDEVNGHILHEQIHHSHRDGAPYPIEDCPFSNVLVAKSEVRNYEDRFIRKNGDYLEVMCNARPINDESDAVGTVIEALDLTQQKVIAAKLRESEELFVQLADAIPQLAWTARPDGHIDWYNNRWYEYTGTTFDEMQGWGWQSIQHPDHLERVVAEWKKTLETGNPFDNIFPLRGGNGEYRQFLTRIMPFRDDQGHIVRWFGTNTDITEQKRIQEELREVAARLSEADRRKDEFLATLAHELRNPLAPIRTGLEVMRLVKDDPKTVDEILSTMERQTQQLITLVDDLLDVSRITQGKLDLRRSPVNLADVIRSAVEASQPFIDEAGHELSVMLPDHPVFLNADPNRIAQVLSNLLNNAAKYTLKGGRIWLSTECQNDEVSVIVKDTGVGIPEEMKERIFEMFAQIDRPMEKGYTGLGIGLTLVKSLVKMHGGTAEVQSEGVNQGSEFRIRLPILMEMEAESAPPRDMPENFSKCQAKVLIVDDNTAAAEMLSMVVELLGEEVRVASDGQEAIEVAERFLPNIILMDLGMPKMNGYEAARYIRQQPWGKKMMLVALTGWGQDEDKQRTFEAGFDHHLVKPAEPSELRRLFSSFLGS